MSIGATVTPERLASLIHRLFPWLTLDEINDLREEAQRRGFTLNSFYVSLERHLANVQWAFDYAERRRVARQPKVAEGKRKTINLAADRKGVPNAPNILTGEILYRADGTALPAAIVKERGGEKVSEDYVIVGSEYEGAVKRELEIRKGYFITDFVQSKRGTEKQALEAWNRMQKAKRMLDELEERSRRELMGFKPIEKQLRIWLEARGEPRKVIGRTVKAWRSSFERAQHHVRQRLETLKRLEKGEV